ncbi:MAG: hypothetical protein JF616_13790 [Fibrobacteres bacterium]|nr:hypothetical protein [Fibrobacterota bacterium]
MRVPLHTRSLILDAETAEGYVRFRIQGEYDAKDLEGMILPMLEEVVRQGFMRAYIDITQVTGELPDFDRFTLAESFARHWGAKRRAAIQVDTARQRINKLFENVAVNRSAQVRVGDQPDALLAWLMAD